jgi:hypothetical protein
MEDRLFNIYDRLWETDFIYKKKSDEASLQEFEDILNEAYPKNAIEFRLYNIVRGFYNVSSNEFKSILFNRRNKYLRRFILWTDSRLIKREFFVPKNVTIKWDNEQKKYSVQKQQQSVNMFDRRDKKIDWADSD